MRVRKQRILSLHRQHTEPKTLPLYYRSSRDRKGTLRCLEDPQTVLRESEIKKQYRLEPFAGGFPDMSVEEIGAFIHEIGQTIPYRRIQDPSSQYYGRKIQEPDVEMFRARRI